VNFVGFIDWFPQVLLLHLSRLEERTKIEERGIKKEAEEINPLR
jgi:hypothetical protein